MPLGILIIGSEIHDTSLASMEYLLHIIVVMWKVLYSIINISLLPELTSAIQTRLEVNPTTEHSACYIYVWHAHYNYSTPVTSLSYTCTDLALGDMY